MSKEDSVDVTKLERLNEIALRGVRRKVYILAFALVISALLNIWQAL